ncbi:ribosomal protein S5 domain 2-type protein [Cristinia sonorae]|uniref:Ribosomal protein S5 domain 2-type protein n=1 Tax=Cristinia sonorae TaxID=1940300 RepID=A0A8K0UEU1_9AGAR|nr:ribosomal protein S5 domain 2-type protein [Cristinia sonorae]
MARHDEREDDEIREMEVVYERLDRVDGSSRFGFGQTQTLVSISGPIEARLASESPSQAVLDIHVRPLASVPGTDAKALAAILKSVLTPSLLLSHNPRTSVQIVGQALCGNESGSGTGSVGRGWNASLIASLINATSAALLSAGSIPMKGVVCAVAVGRLPNIGSTSSRLVLDPSEAESALLTAGGCFAFLFSATVSEDQTLAHPEVPSCSLIWTNFAAAASSFDQAELANSIALARAGAVSVWQRLKDSVADLESRAVPSLKRARKGKSAHISEEIDDEKMEI